jgi:hypothetical protein
MTPDSPEAAGAAGADRVLTLACRIWQEEAESLASVVRAQEVQRG